MEAQQELLRNKLSPSATPASQMPLMKGRGLTATDTGPFSGADVGNCKMAPAPSVSQFKSRTVGQQPGVLLYDYSADEIGHCTNLYPTIQQWAYNMHQAGISNLVSISPKPGCTAMVPGQADPPWTYGCCSGHVQQFQDRSRPRIEER